MAICKPFRRVRVVHERAAGVPRTRTQRSYRAGMAGWIEPRHAVHTIGQTLTAPMHTGVLRQLVGNKDGARGRLNHFHRRPRGLTVVAPIDALSYPVPFHAPRVRPPNETLLRLGSFATVMSSRSA